MTKTASKTKTVAETKVSVEDLAFNIVEVTGGKQFPVGKQFECHKSGTSKRTGRDYAMVLDGGELKFANPKFLKIVKAIPAAKKAAVEAELEEAASATMLISGTVVQETEKAIKFRHTGWKDLWLPKTMAERLCTNDDEIIIEVPRWKVTNGVAGDCVAALEAKQSLYRSIVDAEEAAEEEATKPVVLKKGSNAAAAAAAAKAKLAKRAS